MPLKTGSLTRKSPPDAVHAAISHDIAEMLRAYASTGKIGNTTPRNKAHAQQIALAAAYANARRHAGAGKVGKR